MTAFEVYHPVYNYSQNNDCCSSTALAASMVKEGSIASVNSFVATTFAGNSELSCVSEREVFEEWVDVRSRGG